MSSTTKKCNLTKYMSMMIFRLALTPDTRKDGFATIDENSLSKVRRNKSVEKTTK